MSFFPGETGSSQAFDDKIQGLDKRRRSREEQRTPYDKAAAAAPVLPILPPFQYSHEQSNTPNATNLVPPKDLSGCAPRPVVDGDAYDEKPGHTGRRIASPHLSLSRATAYLFSLSKRHDADSSRRGLAGDNLCASSLFARKHPTQIIPDTVDSTLAWQAQVIWPSHSQQEAPSPPRNDVAMR